MIETRSQRASVTNEEDLKTCANCNDDTAQDHITEQCPRLKCESCEKLGHLKEDCPTDASEIESDKDNLKNDTIEIKTDDHKDDLKPKAAKAKPRLLRRVSSYKFICYTLSMMERKTG